MMSDLALVRDRHCFKPAMRVRANAERLFTRWKIDQRIVVEQKERTHSLACHRAVRKESVYIETIADPVAGRRCDDLLYFLYVGL